MAQLRVATSDIVVHGADQSLLALVAIRNWRDFSTRNAIDVRDDLVAHGEVSPWARFFLIVSQETGYLWQQDGARQPVSAEPTVEFPMQPVIALYLSSFADGRRLSRSEIRLAVDQWMWDMANRVANRPEASEAAIRRSTDFVQLMSGARVSLDDAD